LPYDIKFLQYIQPNTSKLALVSQYFGAAQQITAHTISTINESSGVLGSHRSPPEYYL
jgi:hypothetical protein